MRSGAGFTLIELLVTVAVAGVLLAMIVPSFTQTVASNRLTAAANAVVASLNQARLQAIRRNTLTQFCSNLTANNGTDALGTSCTAAAGAVFVLEPAGTTTQIQEALLLTPDIVLGDGSTGAAMTALRYGSTGLASAVGGSGPYTGLIADLYTTRLSSNNRRCLYLTTGSAVSTCTYTGNSTCPSSEPTTCQQP